MAKKILALALTLALALAFTACGDTTSTTDPTPVTEPTTTTASELPEVEFISSLEYANLSEEEQQEYEEYLLDQYFEYLKVLHPQQSPQEWEHGLYHTVQFDRRKSAPAYSGELLLGVDTLGNLRASWLPNAGFGSAIVDDEAISEDNASIVLRNDKYCVSYNALTGELTQYFILDGEEHLGYVPRGSLHVGNSALDFLYFQSGEEVWVVKPNSLEAPKKIADGVEFVVDTDYNFAPDAISEPLFLMKDGSLKAYLYYKPTGERLVDPRDYRLDHIKSDS